MDKKERRVFTKEFKKEVVARAAQGERVAELAKQHNLTVTTIYGWRRQLRDEELDVAVDKAPRVKQAGVNPKYVRDLEEKLRESNEKLGQLYLVVEALKKMDPGLTKNANSYIVTGGPWARSRRRVK